MRFSELVLKLRETTLGPTSGDSGGDGPKARPRDEGRSVLMLIELPCPWPWPPPPPGTGEAEA